MKKIFLAVCFSLAFFFSQAQNNVITITGGYSFGKISDVAWMVGGLMLFMK
jgi:hypothetical protein